MLTIAPATAADIKSFYPDGTPTMKAFCARRDGDPVLIVGIAFERKRAKFFSDNRMTDKELHSVSLWRTALKAMEFVKQCRLPVVAVAEHDQGAKNLERLGFRRVTGDTYLWHG